MKRGKRTEESEFHIGAYQLGWRMVDLWAMPSKTGAWFSLIQNHKQAEIHVGMNYGSADHAFACLCHEVWEMAMDDMGLVFKPKAFEEDASDIYRFFFDHNQHTEISARASYFLWKCLDDFKRAFKKCRNPK